MDSPTPILCQCRALGTPTSPSAFTVQQSGTPGRGFRDILLTTNLRVQYPNNGGDPAPALSQSNTMP